MIRRTAPLALFAVLFATSTASAADETTDLFVYFGTYTRGDSEGIYVSRFNAKTGTLGEPQLAGKAENPSFLEVHPNGRFVYAVGEIANFGGKKEGGIGAFKIDPKTGMLELLNAQSTGGAGPCHVSLDPTGTSAYVANYGGGSVASLPIGKDGALGEASSFHQHEGASVDPRRQQGPHAHSINLDATGRFAVAADLGLDKLMIYEVDPETKALSPHGELKTPPAGGPRHFAFHPNGEFAYANLEMTRQVAALKWNGETGSFETIGVHSTLPKDAKAEGSTAETRVHPSGKFVYVSNRGHDSIAAYRVDQKTGDLSPIGVYSSGGQTPRNFQIDPTGQWILAANQSSGNVVVLKIDQKTGALEATGTEIDVPNPVCVRFTPAG